MTSVPLVEYRVLRPDGSVRTVEASGRDINFQGSPARLAVIRDMTERKWVEEQLRRAREREALHVQQTPLAVIHWNLDFEVTDWNPAAVRIFGYSKNEAIGQHASFIVPEIYRAHVDKVWEALLLQEGGRRSTNENTRKDETTIHCEWFNTPLIDAQGNVIAVASLVQDVTVRQEAERRLDLCAGRLGALNDIQQAILAATSKEEIAHAALRHIRQLVPNRRCSATEFHQDVGETMLLAGYVGDEIHPNIGMRTSLDEMFGYRGDLLQGGVYMMDDISTLSPMPRSLQPLMDEGLLTTVSIPLSWQGEVIGALNFGAEGPEAFAPEHIAIAQEVADMLAVALHQARLHEQLERHAADLERQVAERTAELNAIQECMTEGLIVLDSKRRIRYYNPAAQELYRGNTELKIGQHFDSVSEAVRPAIESYKDQEAREGEFYRLIDGLRQEPVTLEFRIVRPREWDVLVTGFPILIENGHSLVGILSRDVTEKRQEERRRENFIGVASHELRTPMSIITGFSELLLTQDPPKKTRRQWADYINRESWKITAILEDLLDVSRIQSGKLVIHEEDVSLSEVVNELVSGLRSAMDTHEFEVQLEPDLPNVVADRQRLGQVLINLLSNAVKYSPDGGRVTVSARWDSGQGRVLVAISDEGIGISVEDQERIFGSFERVDRDETSGVQGTGLGLYIVRFLVEQMNATVRVESELGKGSTFFVSLLAR